MNRIYKVIWSKVKHQYVVVSELAHSCTKSNGASVGRSAAAVLAVLALMAGVGFMPAQAADTTDEYGNNIWGEDNSLTDSTNNIVLGNGGYFLNSHDNVYVGNGNGNGGNYNMSNVQNSAVFGDNVYIHGVPDLPTTETLVIGNDVTLNSTDKSLILGSDNWIGSADNSLVIGDRVQIVSGKEGSERVNSTVVIGDDVQVGNHLDDSTGSSASAAGDNITIIGDHVQVDNGPNRTNSSNSLIYGNNVNMVNSQNSVAIGNALSIVGTSDVGDNISIGNDITLGGENGSAAIAMGNEIKAYGHDNILFGNNIDITENAGITGVVVMGTEADVTGFDGVAIGTSATSDGNFALAFGKESTAKGTATIAVGANESITAAYGSGLGAYTSIGTGSDGSTALGSWTSVGENSMASIAIGGAPFNGGAHATIGNDASRSVAIGNGASIADRTEDSIALGSGASVTAPDSFITLPNASGSTLSGIAIGTNSSVTNASGIAIGDNAGASGSGSIAMGIHSKGEGANSVAIGYNTDALSANGIAIGYGAKLTKAGTNGSGAIAVGYDSESGGQYGVAIGSSATVGTNTYNSMALGKSAKVQENSRSAIALGDSANVGASYSTAIGHNSKVNSTYALAIGDGASIGSAAGNSIAMGYNTKVKDKTTLSIALGDRVTIGTADGDGTPVALQQITAVGGYGTNVSAAKGSAVGSQANVTGEEGSAFGYASQAIADYSTVYGSHAAGNAVGSTALGYNSSVAEGADNSVALGRGTTVTSEDILTSADIEKYKTALGGAYNAAWNITDADGNGVVSVGSKDKERRLINVARGRIDETSTDAVNGSQLYGLANDLNQKIENAGGDWVLTTNGGPSAAETTTVGKGNTVDLTGAEDADTNHQNIQVSQTQVTNSSGEVTGTNVSFDLNDRIELGTGESQIIVDATAGKGSITIGNNVSMSATGAANFGNIKLNSEGIADPQHSSTITGLTNKTWNQAGTYTAGRAATEEQLQDAIGEVNKNAYKGWNLKVGDTATPVNSGDTVLFRTDTNDKGASNLYITKDKLNVTVGMEDEITLTGVTADRISVGDVVINKSTGINAGGLNINGVKDGEISEDSLQAVNGSQLWQMQQTVSQQHTTMTVNGGTEAVEGGYSTDGNLQLKKTTSENDQIEYDVKLNDKVVLGTDTSKQIMLDGTAGLATIGNAISLNGTNGQASFGAVKINGESGGEHANTITGLTNKTWNQEGTYTDGRAATEEQLQDAIGEVNENAYKGWNISANGAGQGVAVGNGATVDFSSEDNAVGEKNISISQDSTTGDLTFDLNDKVVLGTDASKQIMLDGTAGLATIGNAISLNGTNGQASFGAVKINGESGGEHANTITGLTNKTWNQAGTYTDGRAATEEQLQDAIGEVNKNAYKGWNISANGAEQGVAVGNGATVDFSSEDNAVGEKNISISQDSTTGDLTFDLNDKVVLGTDASKQIMLDGTTGLATIGNAISLNGTNGQASFGAVKINGESGGEHANTITGLSNKTWDQAGTYTDGRAATEEQLQDAIGEVNKNAYKGWNVSANGGSGVAVAGGSTVDFSGAEDEEGNQNIIVTQDGTNLKFDLNDKVAIGDDDMQIFLNGQTGTLTVGGITIQGGGTSHTINGLTNTTWDPDHYVSGQAATEDQLHEAISNVESNFQQNDQHLVQNLDATDGHYSVDGNNQVNLKVQNGVDEQGNAKYDTVTIDNVASASDVGDVGKLEEAGLGVGEDGTTNVVDAILDVDGKVDDLGERIDGVEETAGKHSSVSNTDGNITVDDTKLNEAGGVDYNVGLNNEKITVGNETNNVTIEGNKGSITVTNSVSAGQTTISNEGVSVGDKTYITSEGINANNQVITNVAAGEISDASTDAVNGSQLYGVQQQVANNATAITNIGNKVGELDNRIDEVGAGAAALAALHPLDFDPDDKWDFAAGYGNYRGENAVAVGAFYRPNEDTMFSVGGTVGNGDNMVNAGVSFKIGQGNGVSTSRVAMAKEIKSMRDIVAKQDAQIQKLTAMVNALVGVQAIKPDTTTMFPDVPENHWAYEAVETMVKTGLVEGYPDGEFKGDRSMTRYEFAQIVHNAIQAGLDVDTRLVREFQPELQYFRIDTISKDKDGNPVIQRVRANDVPVQQ